MTGTTHTDKTEAVSTEQASSKGRVAGQARDELHAEKKLAIQEFMKVVHDGVEGRMHSRGLRVKGREVIDVVYGTYLKEEKGKGGLKDLSIDQIKSLTEQARQLANLATSVDEGAASFPPGAFEQYNTKYGVNFDPSTLAEPHKTNFFMSHDSLIWQQKRLGSFRGFWIDDNFSERNRSETQVQFAADDIERALEYVKQFQGANYVWGGTSEDGMDCSAFVSKYLNYLASLHGQSGVGRLTTDPMTDFARSGGVGNSALAGLVDVVPSKELKRGDIIVWNEGGKGHTGIYLGFNHEGKELVIDASGHKGSEGQVEIRGLKADDKIAGNRASFLSYRRANSENFYVLRPKSDGVIQSRSSATIPPGDSRTDNYGRTRQSTMQSVEIAQLLRAEGCPPEKIPLWVAICLAESGGDPRNSYTPRKAGGGFKEQSFGLFQVNRNAHPQYSEAELYDPARNVAIARIISNDWTKTQPWGAFTNGRYAQFLDQGRYAAQVVAGSSRIG